MKILSGNSRGETVGSLSLFRMIAFCGAAFLIGVAVAGASEQILSPPPGDDTLLMFVGEDIEVLSIASRRRESAGSAPAVAKVITRQQLEERGIRTVSQALEMTPGFYMAKKEWGTEPYLRGIPQSALFLYDTVPLGSDTTKSLIPIDYQLSLASVKRIEIIRGPGSVLWGPDAFAGIVNLVPLTGKDVNGVDAGVSYGAPGDQESFYINMGRDGGHWDAFLSLSGRNGEEDTTFCNIARFWKTATKPYSPEDRYGEEWPGNAQYLTVAGNFSFRDWITLSGMISDYSRPYAMTGPDRDLTWRESRSAPFGFFKIEAKKDIDEVSALRFTGTYSRVNPEIEIINRTLNSKEQATYAELIYDRSFLAGKTLVTGGLSFREKDITDATIWESYFPDYLSESNELLLPILKMEDYRTQLLSAFCQFRQKIGAVDFWLGFRYDDHNAYKDHVSYNAGAVWKPSSQWLLKALYGTAYRTPFARQLRLEDEPELESIETGNLQIAWKPVRYVSMTATGYLSRVRNHTMEDAYAGLSQPNRQDSEGVELECTVTPSEKLEVAANLTLLDNDGPDETYHYNDYSYFDPVEGKWVKHYTDLRYPFDTGAKSLFNLLCTWRPFDHLSLFGRIGYVGPRDLVYARGEAFRSLPGVWLADLSSVLRNIAGTGLDLRVSVKNLTDRDYETPGTYSTIWGDPLSAEIMLSKRW